MECLEKRKLLEILNLCLSLILFVKVQDFFISFYFDELCVDVELFSVVLL